MCKSSPAALTVQKQNGLLLPTSIPSVASRFVNTTRLWRDLENEVTHFPPSHLPLRPRPAAGRMASLNTEPDPWVRRSTKAGWSLLGLRLCSYSNLLVEMARKPHCHYWWERELFITEKTMFTTLRYRLLFPCQPFNLDLHDSDCWEKSKKPGIAKDHV